MVETSSSMSSCTTPISSGGIDGSEDCRIDGSEDCRKVVGSVDCRTVVDTENCSVGACNEVHMNVFLKSVLDMRKIHETLRVHNDQLDCFVERQNLSRHRLVVESSMRRWPKLPSRHIITDFELRSTSTTTTTNNHTTMTVNACGITWLVLARASRVFERQSQIQQPRK